MNKILLFIILYFFLGNLFSQPNYASHFQNDEPTAIFVDGNLTFYTTSESIAGVSFTNLYCINGSIKFKYTFNSIYNSNVTDIKKLANGNIGLSGNFMPQCDVPNYNLFFAEIDTNGVLLNLATASLSDYWTSNHNVKWFELTSGEKLIVCDSLTGIYNAGNAIPMQIENTGEINGSYYNAAEQRGYVNYCVKTGTTNTYHFNVYDLNSGNQILNIPFDYQINKMLKSENKFYYGLTDSSYVIKFDTLFNVISNSKLSQGTFKINDFDIKNDTIYACAEDTLVLLKFNANLNLVYQYTNNQPLIKNYKIGIAPSSIIFLSREEANNTFIKYSNVLMASTDFNGHLNLKNDTYVEDFVVISGSSDPFPANNNWPVNVNLYYSLGVKVRNNGTDTLKSVYLNQMPRLSQSSICGYYLNHYLAQNISIAPGKYAYIAMPTYNDVFTVYPGQQPTNDSVFLASVCVWTSGPNFNGDNDHMNDAICNAVIKLPVITGGDKHSFFDQGIRIYPNPASQNINLQFTGENQKNFQRIEFKIINTLGQYVKGGYITSDKYTINLEELESGIYLIAIINEGSPVYTSKFVKN